MRFVAGLLGTTLLLLTGCGAGSDVRAFLADRYRLQDSRGDVATYLSQAPLGTTTAAIAGAVPPAARGVDGGSEYLRYDDDIVVVSGAPDGGSAVRVEDLDDRYNRGFYAFLGPGFRPGSPAGGAGGGGPGDVK